MLQNQNLRQPKELNKKTGKVESMIEGNEIPIKDQIPDEEDGLYFKED